MQVPEREKTQPKKISSTKIEIFPVFSKIGTRFAKCRASDADPRQRGEEIRQG